MQSSIELVLESPELVQNILYYADYDSVTNYCQTSRMAADIYQSRVFWEEKAEIQLGIPRDLFRMTHLSPSERYLEFINSKAGVPVDNRYMRLDKFALWCFETRNSEFLDYAVRRGFNNQRDLTLRYARMGNQQMVDRYLNSTSYLDALRGALAGNHKNLFNYIYQRAPEFINDEHIKHHWKYLVKAAAVSGNPLLFDYITSIIPQNYEHNIYQDIFKWEHIVNHSCVSGSIPMFEHIRSLIPAGYLEPHLPHLCLVTALEHNHKELYDHISKMAPSDAEVPQYELYRAAVVSDNPDLFKYISESIPPDVVKVWNNMAYTALNKGNKAMFNYILDLMPGYKWKWDEFIMQTMVSGDKYLVNYVISLIPTNNEYNWTEIIKQVIHKEHNGHLEMLNDVLVSVSQNYILNWDDLAIGVIYVTKHDIKILKFIMSFAPPNHQWNWNEIVEYSYVIPLNMQLFMSLKELASHNYQWNWNVILKSLLKRNPTLEIINYVRSLAPPDYQWDWVKLLTGLSEIRNTTLHDYIASLADT